MPEGWIGVDLDGTLAYYDEWRGIDHIGSPIEPMVNRVKKWLSEGHDVRVFTARISHDDSQAGMHGARQAERTIEAWCLDVFGKALPVTNIKDYSMIELWDDRAVGMEQNTGRQLNPSTRGL